MKILVTGAAGFIGMHTTLRLLARGDEVVGLDNLNDYYDPTLKEARLAKLRPHASFRFVKMDVADRPGMEKLFAEQRFRYFDFTEGDGAHKALFGTHQVQCATLFLLAPSIANRAVLTGHRAFNGAVEGTGAWLERIGAKAKIRKLLRG